MKDPTDNLSPLARKLLKLNAKHAYEKLTISEGDGNREAFADLMGTTGSALCAKEVIDTDEAACLHAALYLWHDFLHEAHEICQAVETPSGSFWHAILHRREGDFSNAKYWYARVGKHPAYEAIAANAATLLREAPADTKLLKIFTPTFSGPALVDLVQSVHHTPAHPNHKIAIALQQLEWRTLFEFNAAHAQR